MIQSTPGTTAEFPASSHPVLRRYIRADVASLPLGTDLKSLGVDSLKFMMLVLELEEVLGRALFAEDEPPAIRTVGDLQGLIGRGAQ